jgi:transcriptional regulator with XRE-family HTH domain
MITDKQNTKANRIDAHVGRRLRERRVTAGMSVRQLADLAGLSRRQIQKYELGIDRIGAGDLYRLARFFDVPVSYFFAGLPGGRAARDELFEWRETLDFVRAYYGIASPKRRRKVYELIQQMAQSPARG